MLIAAGSLSFSLVSRTSLCHMAMMSCGSWKVSMGLWLLPMFGAKVTIPLTRLTRRLSRYRFRLLEVSCRTILCYMAVCATEVEQLQALILVPGRETMSKKCCLLSIGKVLVILVRYERYEMILECLYDRDQLK